MLQASMEVKYIIRLELSNDERLYILEMIDQRRQELLNSDKTNEFNFLTELGEFLLESK